MPSLVEIGPVVLDEGFKILSMYLCSFVIIFPWKKGWALHFNNFEFPLPKDVFCEVWLKLAHWLEKIFYFSSLYAIS